VLSASVGYVAGAQVAAVMPAQLVICWVLLGSLPLTLPLALWLWPAAPVLGERLQPLTAAFSLAVIAVVFVSRRMPVHRRA